MTTPTPEDLQSFQNGLVRQINEDTVYILLIVISGVIGLLSAGFTIHDWRRYKWKNLFPDLAILAGLILFCVSLWVITGIREYFFDISPYLAVEEIARTWTVASNTKNMAFMLSFVGFVPSLLFMGLGLAGIFKNWRYKRRQRRETEVVFP
jgi:hypothetical protein